MKNDCCFYNGIDCNILNKLYCNNDKCSFYKKGEFKEDIVKKNKNKKKFVEYPFTKIRKSNIKYKNYGNLEFTEDEIIKLKNKKLKIH